MPLWNDAQVGHFHNEGNHGGDSRPSFVSFILARRVLGMLREPLPLSGRAAGAVA
jgi:hypothetical protein